jgi:hypothetical protein
VQRMCCAFARIAGACRGLRGHLRHRIAFLRQAFVQLETQTEAWAARPTACTQSRNQAFQRFQHVLYRFRHQLHSLLCVGGLDRPSPARPGPELANLEPLLAFPASLVSTDPVTDEMSWSSDDSGSEGTS